jgi:alanine dehydrogenase
MIVGVPREIKTAEQRVALTPAGAHALVEHGHRVLVEETAGLGSGIRDEEYATAGAALASKERVWGEAEMIIKVKEPLPPEYPMLRAGQVVFTYLHLAAALDLTRALAKSGVIAIGYETVQRPDGSLPLLTPMSEVAGRLAVQEGAYYLGRAHGGRGILLSGVPGVPRGNVVIIGAGTVGLNAVKAAVGSGADVSVLDVNLDRLRHLDDLFAGRIVTLASNRFTIGQAISALICRERRPHHRRARSGPRGQGDGGAHEAGSVIVDVAVDQGGASPHPLTTLDDPIYQVSGRPLRRREHAGARAADPTFALANATLPYASSSAIAGPGRRSGEPQLARGVNVGGWIVHPGVAGR